MRGNDLLLSICQLGQSSVEAGGYLQFWPEKGIASHDEDGLCLMLRR